MGSLMSELGCARRLGRGLRQDRPAAGGRHAPCSQRSSTSRRGPTSSRSRLNGSWDENYGDSEGTYDNGGNIPLPLESAARLRFSYDHATHAVQCRPRRPRPRRSARPTARWPRPACARTSRKERFYFVMADRFANGSTDQRHAVASPAAGSRPASTPRTRPSTTAVTSRGLIKKLDYIEDLGTTAHLDDALVQEQAGAGHARQPSRPATTATGSPTSPRSTRTWAPTPTSRSSSARRTSAASRSSSTSSPTTPPTSSTTPPTSTSARPATSRSRTSPRPRSRTATRPATPFDDRDYASGNTFPEVDAATTFPYVPTFRSEADKTVKVPAWLNDPTMYHNRGTSIVHRREQRVRRLPRR